MMRGADDCGLERPVRAHAIKIEHEHEHEDEHD